MTHRYFRDLPRRIAADKYHIIKHLILLKTEVIMDINAYLLQQYNFLIKSLQVVVLKVKLF